MDDEFIANILQELDELKEQKDILEYRVLINGLIKQVDILKKLEVNQIIIIDNRYDEKLDNLVLTYFGPLGDKFIPLTGSVVSDERIPHIKLQFQQGQLNQFYYIDRGYAVSLKAVPGDIGRVYPHSEVLFKYDEVIERLASEHLQTKWSPQ